MQNQESVSWAATLDRDAWVSAGKLLRTYGPRAFAKAAQEVAYSANHGDVAAAGSWSRVSLAIGLLTSTEGQLPN